MNRDLNFRFVFDTKIGEGGGDSWMDALMFASYHYARNVGWYSLKESQAGRVG